MLTRKTPYIVALCFLFLIVTGFLIVRVSITYAQPTGGHGQLFETPDEAAKKAIEAILDSSYFDRITEKEARLLGYKSKDEIKIAKLGPPLPIWIVGLKQLREFKSGDDPEKVLTNANFMLYPLMVGEEVRTSLTVRRSPKSTAWKTTEWGSAASLVRELWKHRTSSSNFVVSIPSLNLHFVADRQGDNLILNPITDYPVHGFKAGMRIPAQRLFAALQKEAETDRGGPR